MMQTTTIIIELVRAIKNREDHPEDFNSEYQRGETDAFREVLRRIKQTMEIEI